MLNDLGFSLHPTQSTVAKDRHRFRVLCNGRRWGKTTLAIDTIKARASVPDSRVCYVAPTYQQARDIAWEALKRDCMQAATSINESRLEIKLVNNSLIILRGWEAIETLRGQAFDLIVIDEVAMMRDFWLKWQEIIRPTLTDTRGEGLFISTPKGFNSFYDLYNLQDEDTDFKSFHFTTYDNPHIPVDEIDKAKRELSIERFQQEYMADFKKTEGLVYKEFDRTKHLFKDMTENEVERIAGVDFGFTNPCAIPTIVRDRTDCYWITEEFYETGRTDVEVAEYTAAKSFTRVYPDPEAPAAIAELRKRGVNVREVIKGKDSIKNGIDKVREMLKANKLKVHVSCKNTIMEFETYSYPDKKDLHNEEEKPIKESDHMMDALRYVFLMVSKSQGRAPVYYPSSNMPRNNLDPLAGPPPDLNAPVPKYATTYIPKL